MEERRTTDLSAGDTARILAILYTIGFFLLVGAIMRWGIPPDNKDTLNQLIGGLTIIQTTIIAFYFGGSKSKEKADVALQDIAKGAPASTAAAVAATVAATTAAATPPPAIPLVPVDPPVIEVQPQGAPQ